VSEAVSKTGVAPERLKAVGIELPQPDKQPTPAPIIAFTPESEVYQAIERRMAAFDFEALAKLSTAEGIDRCRGRV
jgi:hypothetical protein